MHCDHMGPWDKLNDYRFEFHLFAPDTPLHVMHASGYPAGNRRPLTKKQRAAKKKQRQTAKTSRKRNR